MSLNMVEPLVGALYYNWQNIYTVNDHTVCNS